jgi:hypothetical protein
VDIEYIALLVLIGVLSYYAGRGVGEDLGQVSGELERIRLMERIRELEKKIEDISCRSE